MHQTVQAGRARRARGLATASLLLLCLTAVAGEPPSSGGWARARPVGQEVTPVEAEPEAPSSAFAKLSARIEALDQRLEHEARGYFDLKQRAALESERATLRAAYQRLLGFSRALPPGCLRMLRDQQRAVSDAPTPPKDPLVAAAARDPMALPAADDRSKVGMLCRPRGAPSDELVAKVIAAEQLKHELATTPVTYHGQRVRAELEQRVERAEEELLTLGVPGEGLLRVQRSRGR
jgi:hypothetical protein